jgi:hypothetical protein
VIRLADSIEKHLLELNWEETKLRKTARAYSGRSLHGAARQKISAVIPAALSKALEEAFLAAFHLVFRQGAGFIELTFNKKELRANGKLLAGAAEPLSPADWARLDHQIHKGTFANTAFATIDGGLLGFFGIGFPDIPVILAAVMKNIYEIALRHGFSYEGKGEGIYILTLISAALAQGAEQESLAREVDDMAERLDMGLALYESEKEALALASRILAQAMLIGKFIQGCPVAGVAGAFVNNALMRKISRHAALKYKKRLLLRQKSRTQEDGKK